MKTTIDIADNILQASKNIARKDNVTLRRLVEEGLEMVIAKRKNQTKKFKLRPVVFNKGGLHENFKNAPWEKTRDEIYENRGV